MAVIADDCPAQEKASPADITAVDIHSPSLEEVGFSIDKSKKGFQLCNTDQDSDKEPSPLPENPTEPPSPPPAQKKGKKRKKRKQKKKKIKKVAIKVIKGPRSKPGHFSGKFLFKLPKKANKHGIILVALFSLLQYHMAQSALNCMKSVPVSDFPINLKHNDQNFIFQKRTFCPDKVDIFGSCAACYKNKSLEIFCANAVALEIWVKNGKGNDEILGRMTSKDCNFVKKSQGRRMKRSERSLGRDLKVSETSVEEKHEHGISKRNNDEEICNVLVPVTDFPIVIIHNNRPHIFHEAKLCPKRSEVLEICSACFMDESLLDMSCRKRGDGDHDVLWVEHGKGQGHSTYVELNSEVCHKIKTNVSKRQGGRSDGGTSTENTEGNKGTWLQNSGVFVTALFFLCLWI